MKIKSILILSCLPFFIFANETSDELKLKSFLEKEFPGVIIKSNEQRDGFAFCWELIINQKLDHWDEKSGVFPQKILLYHKSFKSPNVLVTEGYNVIDRIYESTMILDANQFSIEYRFFGNSRPEHIDWKLLNHKQALEDLHLIRTRLAKIYKQTWIATGISKGGTTAALYSLSYPKDVSASVAYVAPFVLEQEDKRTIDHYRNKVSTPECRQKVRDFQRDILLHRNELKLMLTDLEKRDSVYFPMDKDKVIDFASMEYPFSIWQWGFGCQEIPDKNADAKTIFDHIEEVVDFNYYDNKSCSSFLPAYYQFMTEFGYYGFDTTGISDLLVYPQLSNLEFCPKDADLTYHGEYINSMYQKAIHESKNIIFIYGELDTWTSCAIVPDPKTNAMKFVKANGGHRTRIRDFSDSEKQLIYSALEKWTKHKTKALPY
jgi:hypothetical protein